MRKIVKKHPNGNQYLLSEHGKWVRNFTLDGKIYHDLNNTIEHKDHFRFLENEISNASLRLSWIDTEKNYHPNIVIVSDGYDFNNRHQFLNSLPKDITIIGVNGALAKWNNLQRSLNYYVVNNPYEECMKYFPRRLKNFPKCIASVRTYHEFLKIYRGTKYKYYPVNESNFTSIGAKEVEWQIDDYRNPICAAIGLAYHFGVENLLLYCCDDSFADERASSEKLENGLYLYPQQAVANGIIDANLYWLGSQPYNQVNVGNYSSGPNLLNARNINKTEDILDFFGIIKNEES